MSSPKFTRHDEMALRINIEVVAASAVTTEDLRKYENALSTTSWGRDPYQVLRAKTRGLARLLNCTEEEAERLILDRAEIYGRPL